MSKGFFTLTDGTKPLGRSRSLRGAVKKGTHLVLRGKVKADRLELHNEHADDEGDGQAVLVYGLRFEEDGILRVFEKIMGALQPDGTWRTIK